MLLQVGYDKYISERCIASHAIVAQVCAMKSLIRVAFTVEFAEAPRRRLMQTLMMAVVALCWCNISTEIIREMIYWINQWAKLVRGGS